MHIYIYLICICVYIYTPIYIWIYDVYVYGFVHLFICIYICSCVYINICMYIPLSQPSWTHDHCLLHNDPETMDPKTPSRNKEPPARHRGIASNPGTYLGSRGALLAIPRVAVQGVSAGL